MRDINYMSKQALYRACICLLLIKNHDLFTFSTQCTYLAHRDILQNLGKTVLGKTATSAEKSPNVLSGKDLRTSSLLCPT